MGTLGRQLVRGSQIDGEAEWLAGKTAFIETERQRDAERQLAGTDGTITQVGVTLGRTTTWWQLAYQNEGEDTRVASVLNSVRNKLERQKAKVMDGQAWPIACVHCDADAAGRHVQTDQWEVFAAFQTSKIINKCVDWLACMLYAPKSSARLASNVLGYELLRQIFNLPNNAQEYKVNTAFGFCLTGLLFLRQYTFRLGRVNQKELLVWGVTSGVTGFYGWMSFLSPIQEHQSTIER